MSETFTLPSGNTVTLRDPKSIRQRDRKKLYEASNSLTGQLAAIAMTEAVVALSVEAWSFATLSLPNFNIEVLGDLEIPDYDSLCEKATELIPVLFPATAKAEGTTLSDASPFPAAPTSEEPA